MGHGGWSGAVWGLMVALLILLRAGVSLWSDLKFYFKNRWDFSKGNYILDSLA